MKNPFKNLKNPFKRKPKKSKRPQVDQVYVEQCETFIRDLHAHKEQTALEAKHYYQMRRYLNHQMEIVNDRLKNAEESLRSYYIDCLGHDPRECEAATGSSAECPNCGRELRTITEGVAAIECPDCKVMAPCPQ